jgi:hypothetical protein
MKHLQTTVSHKPTHSAYSLPLFKHNWKRSQNDAMHTTFASRENPSATAFCPQS